MASHYAHYRFGAAVIPMLPPQVQRRIRLFRQLYDVGLYGPDPFYYYSLPMKGRVNALGSKYHNMTGEEFFLPVCKHLRLEPNEAAMAYLYGVLAHYCLDSAIHGFVNEQTTDGQISHLELEAEFDRYLLQLDHKPRPHLYDNSEHMKLTEGECDTVSKFYGTSPAIVDLSLKCMAANAKLTSLRNPDLRKLVRKCAGSKMKQNFTERTPNPKCAHLDEPMLALYNQALENFPAMVDALLAHMHHNAPLGSAFEATFNG
jgi:hypothetical protein